MNEAEKRVCRSRPPRLRPRRRQTEPSSLRPAPLPPPALSPSLPGALTTSGRVPVSIPIPNQRCSVCLSPLEEHTTRLCRWVNMIVRVPRGDKAALFSNYRGGREVNAGFVSSVSKRTAPAEAALGSIAERRHAEPHLRLPGPLLDASSSRSALKSRTCDVRSARKTLRRHTGSTHVAGTEERLASSPGRDVIEAGPEQLP